MRELFLCHHAKFAPEVSDLATALRLRGIAPWVDKERGGFLVGDSSPEEARRVIQEDCFGLLLYASLSVFDRWFVREIEIPAAIAAKTGDPSYVLTAFCRGVSFKTLSKRSQERFGIDLSAFHSVASRRGCTEIERRSDWDKTAIEALRKWLSLHPVTPQISLQFSTRQLFPDNPEDVLRIDATGILAGDPLVMINWDALRRGLVDIQSEITYRFGRPRLSIHGSKHLTAAFLFGRVFARNVLAIRQNTDEIWCSDLTAYPIRPFQVQLHGENRNDGSLFVEIAVGEKNVAAGIDALLRTHPTVSPARLSLTPSAGPLQVDNALCVAMVNQVYAEIERAVARTQARSIHLFVAAHQSFMMMLGQRFSGMPEVHLYEWASTQYGKSCVIPAGPAGTL